MGNINFYLKQPSASGRSLIYLKFKYNGKVLVYTFGQSINQSNWNSEKQRVKNNRETTASGEHSLNDLLDNLETVCSKAYNTELKNGIPEPAKLKAHLDNFINQNEEIPEEKNKFYDLIDRFISGEIHVAGKEKSKSTLENYRATKVHLHGYEARMKSKLTFESINLEFFYKYVTYLKGLGLAHNTLAKDIKTLKVFMNEAVDLNYTDNLQFKQKKFRINEIDIENVYITEQEIIDLYNFDLSGYKRLEQVKDLFVFGCFVGLRFSDYNDVKPENIVMIDGEYFIKIITKKTKELVIIPCNPIVLNIFEKYSRNHNKLPKSISSQKFNTYIKEVCEKAGMKEQGRLSSDLSLPLYECISSHTARRSFATNYYLAGFPTLDLMKITGHKSERSFLKYIKVSKEDTAKRLGQLIKKNWSEKMLRVA
jgi:integrase